MSLVKDQLDQHSTEINLATKKLVQKYTDSPSTTNAGKIIRFLSKLVPVDIVLKFLQAKIK